MIYGHRKDGNFSRLMQAFKRTPLFPVIGKGEARIQPIFIDDLVDCFFNVALNPTHIGKSYNVGGEKPVSNLELFKIVRRVFGLKVSFIFVPLVIIMIVVKLLVFIGINVISIEQVLRFTEDKAIIDNNAHELLQRAPLSVENGCIQMKEAYS